MIKIRMATEIVAGNLNYLEKINLISILSKLAEFHEPIFMRNVESKELIDMVYREYFPEK